MTDTNVPVKQAYRLRKMYDESTPVVPPSGFDIAAGYIGGDTPHVWSDKEWDAQPVAYRLPIFVRDHAGDPTADANETLAWLHSHRVPKGVCVALDFETRIDSWYVHVYDNLVSGDGYKVLLYGSESSVLSNPKPSGGYWIASWNGNPNLIDGSPAHQYENREPYDYSVVDPNLPLWHVGATPNPNPGTGTTVLPELREGDQGEAVRTVQGLCLSRHSNPGNVDGVFGPVTDKAVREVQARYGTGVDGIVGPKTWHVLIYAG